MTFSYRSAGFLKRFNDEFNAQELKQTEFAERITAVTGKPYLQSRVSYLLAGKGPPSMEEAELIAAGLGVSVAWLVYESGSKALKRQEGELAKKFPSGRVLKKVDPDAAVSVARKRG